MSKRALAALLAVVAVAAAALALYFFVFRGRAGTASTAVRSGQALAAGLAAAIEEASRIAAPHRCARIDGEEPPELPAPVRTRLEARGMTIDGRTLRAQASGRRSPGLVIGIIADARSPNRDSHGAQLSRVRGYLEKGAVRLLLSLGGMGQTREEIVAALRPFTEGAPWVVIAIPGDRESVTDHRAAIAELNQNEGAPVLDGSEIRFLETDIAMIATVPGAARAAGLVAGIEGCQHTAADLNAVAEALRRSDKLRVWATHAPPRQRGPRGTDLAIGGIHIGEPDLAQAIEASEARLVVHGLVDEAAARQRPGVRSLTDVQPLYLASGALDVVPVAVPEHGIVTGAALVVTIGAREIRWRPIVLESERLRFPLR